MRLRSTVWLAVIAVVFALFLLWPIAQILKVGFFGIATPDRPARFTLVYVLAIFRDSNLCAGLMNSAFIAVCVTVLCTLISLPLAVLSVRYEYAGKRLFSGLL